MKKIYQRIFSETTALVMACIALAVIAIGIWLFLSFGSWQKTNVLDESKIGQFGDFIGGVVGTLVGLTGIILYYVALREQRKDISINQGALNLQMEALNQQIVEFKAQREELTSTRKIYEQQSKTMKNQQFDSNFYSLLQIYLSLKKNLVTANSDFFETFLEELGAVQLVKEDLLGDGSTKISNQYVETYLKYRGLLSPYFKTIYRIIRFIDDNEHLSAGEKQLYAKIIR